MSKNPSTELEKTIVDSYVAYGTAVVLDRALPDVRDGLKVAQRRLLHCMSVLGIKANRGFIKSAKICGQTSGDFHPHGSEGLYGVLARMPQPWTYRYPLLSGQGNFGNVDGDPPAAQRYTEIRTSEIGDNLLARTTDYNVAFMSTYNDAEIEPTILAGAFPNLICNGATGIAVGLSCNYAPHNMAEVCSTIEQYIKNPKLTIDDVLTIMPGPDFSLPCRLINPDAVEKYYRTGKATLELEGVYEAIEQKGLHTIIISSFPPGGNPSKFCEEVADLSSRGLLNIVTVNDLSARKGDDDDGIRVEIVLHKNQDVDLAMNALLVSTCLTAKFSVNQVAVKGNEILTDLSILQLIDQYVQHRRSIIKSDWLHIIEEKQKELRNLRLKQIALDNIDELIPVARKSDNEEQIVNYIIKQQWVDSIEDAKKLLHINVSALSRTNVADLAKSISDLETFIVQMTNKQADIKQINKAIIDDMKSLCASMKHDDRRTIISAKASVKKMVITNQYTVESLNPLKLKLTNMGGDGVVSEHDIVSLFTDSGILRKFRVKELPKGVFEKGLIPESLLHNGEKCLYSVFEHNMPDSIIIIDQQGGVKKLELSTVISGSKAQDIPYIKNSNALLSVMPDVQKLLLVSTSGNALMLNSRDIRPTGRTASTMRGLWLKSGEIVKALPLNDEEYVFAITKYGYGRMQPVSAFNRNRGSVGHPLIKVVDDRNGIIGDVSLCSLNERFMLTTSHGREIDFIMPKKHMANMGVKLCELRQNETIEFLKKIVQ